MKTVLYSFFSFSFLISVLSCGNSSQQQKRAAIIFGDSSTIVTETDPRFLSNNVTDIVPQKIVQIQDSTLTVKPVSTDTLLTVKIAAKIADTTKPIAKNTLNESSNSFKVFINGVDFKVRKSTTKATSIVVDKNNLNGKTLNIKGGSSITKVMQRTQTVVMLKATNGKLFRLSALPTASNEWQTMKGTNGNYILNGLGSGQLRYDIKLTPKNLRSAVQMLARSSKMSRKEEQKLLSSIKSVRTSNQAPCSVALQSVVWKITGKDATNKIIEHEVRADINL